MEKQLILLASPTLRRGPLSALQRFVRDYERFLERYEIVTTEGCRRAILRSGLLHSHQHLKAPLPGYLGGIVELSSLVVNKPDLVEAVIYLIDPRDPSSIFPETNAIKRECVVHKVTFLSTSRAAREWAAMNWAESTPQFVSSMEIGNLPLLRQLDAETIALVAHDGKKGELLEFARDHFTFLLKFRERVATGTTGTLLNGKRPAKDDITGKERITDEEWEELRPICEDLGQRISAEKIEKFVTCMESGPKGGDVMIAMKVLDRECQRLVFFENPMKPHEHTEDIQLLERTGRLRGKYTICVHDQKTATRFVEHWEKTSHANPPRLLLSFVLERLFGVRCILVETSHDEKSTWENLREAAGWFLLSHIATVANERKKASEKLRVSVSWGVGSAKVVASMHDAIDRLKEIEERLRASRPVNREDMEDVAGYADYPFQTHSLADDRYFRNENVIVAPIQGLVGSVDESVEANEIAHRMTELFAGKHVPLAANALVQGGDPVRRKSRFEEIYSHWDSTDIVLATAGPVGMKRPRERPETPYFRGFMEKMKKLGACGDIGGLFLDRTGNPVPPKGFDPTSMSADQLKRVHTRGGVIIVAGAQAARADITLAALLGGWISVLITDMKFAKNIVSKLGVVLDRKEAMLMSPDIDGPLLDCVRRAVGLERGSASGR